MPLNCIFWSISFGRQFVTRPVIWKEISGGWTWGIFLWLFSPFYFSFLWMQERIIAGGLASLIKGAVFFSQLSVFVAELLLLKCNHSNLLLWFPIERISSPSFPEWNLWLFAARVWCFPSHASSVVPADCWYWLFYLACSKDFSGLKLLLSSKTDEWRFKTPSLLQEIGRWQFIYNCKSKIFHMVLSVRYVS